MTEFALSAFRGPPSAESDFDLALMFCGYERRSRYLAEALKSEARERLVFHMQENRVCSYESNREWFLAHGYGFLGQTRADLEIAIPSYVSRSRIGRKAIRALVDISAMPRRLIADLFVLLVRNLQVDDRVVFSYSLSDYIPPPEEVAPVRVSEPINREFAGRLLDVSLPIALIFGLGYEPGRALGCAEGMEANDIFAFSPEGPDLRFMPDVQGANRELTAALGSTRQFLYFVDEPDDLIAKLSSLTLGLCATHRVVLVPFGPKVFAMASLIVAARSKGHATVWRVSGDVGEWPIDRHPSGHVCGFELRLVS